MGCGSSNSVETNNGQNAVIDYNNFILVHKNKQYQQDYQIGRLLGKGSYGAVYVCKNKHNDDIRVMKKMAKEGLTKEELQKNMVTDVAILQKLTHPSVMKTFEFYSDENMFYIVSEYCEGGSLMDRLQQQELFSEKEAANVVKQLLEAINYSHSQGYMHRDLKLDNAVIDKKTPSEKLDYSVKVIDYGCSTKFKKGQKFNEICGTPLYMAPELLKKNYDEKVDVWAIGCIMYILLSGYYPFFGESLEEIFRKILVQEIVFHETINECSEDAKNLVLQLLNKNPSQRPSCSEALKHPWFQNAPVNKLPDELKKEALNNLKKSNAKSNFQQAVLSYITQQLVTKAEQKNLEVAFKEIDVDGNGTLSKEELKKYFEKFMLPEEVEKNIDQLMSKIDEDNTGTIDYNEFIKANVDLNQTLSDKNLKTAFDFFDKDGNGTISFNELEEILAENTQKKVDGKKFLEQLKAFDKNNDQELSFEEFKECMKSLIF
ncbi:Protein kinase-like domain [Pseudocohnilembus persalinus]|uniref:non-specific serine/threonine protein kinase n=1 Tax=Pseudocohnilembus persalinus TaxID=266149 RepID=A0A0V0QAV0_PSEPJ|nr:Protein kinase-like domain [Pseudocohnilembus persalinus]|eukprot:KRW99188.1 Protein kinase-like domain [Pseudocohnilembus persalinus]